VETAQGAFSLESLANGPITALVTKECLIATQSQGIFGQKRTVTVVQDHALTLASDRRLLPGDVQPVGLAERERLMAWRDGRLSFGGEMLADAVRAFDRYGATRIVVADPGLARQKVTGLFRTDDPKGFAMAVAASFGGFVTSEGEVIRISGQASPAA
jgi:transmembrane sensor